MDNCKANKCIECTVTQCRNHCETSNFCALDRIRVGTHEMNPTRPWISAPTACPFSASKGTR